MREYWRHADRREVAFYAVIVVMLVVGLGMLGARYLGGDEVAAEPTASALPVVQATQQQATEEPTPSPTTDAPPLVETTEPPTPTPTPSPTATETEGPAQTVLFQGGPANGPWQQLGTVAEITHADAPETARYSYTNFWSDPNEENQSDALWDQLMNDLIPQLVEMGVPVDRPVLDASPDSEPFNAGGGVQDIYFDEGGFTAQWTAWFEDDDGLAVANFVYLLSFNATVIDSRPVSVIREQDALTLSQVSNEQVSQIRAWAAERGFTRCESCS